MMVMLLGGPKDGADVETKLTESGSLIKIPASGGLHDIYELNIETSSAKWLGIQDIGD